MGTQASGCKMSNKRHKMIESKPVQQYEVVADSGNGKKDVPDGLATIDEQSRQAAMAKAMVKNEKRQREQRCGEEIDAAIMAILKRHKCNAKFCELRENGQTTRIWLQPVALD